MASASVPWSPEDYRSLLLLWARLHLPRALWRREGPSDIVQVALAKAYSRRDQFRGQSEAEWQAWLRRILARAMTDAVRRYTRKGGDQERSLNAAMEASSCRAADWVCDGNPSPPQELMGREQVRRLAEALEHLNPDQRTAFELHYLQEKPVKEVGQLMHKSVAAVAGLLRRGLETLRDLLGDAPL